MCLDQRKRHPIFVKLCISCSSESISENSVSDQDSLAGLNYTLYENEGKTILASDKINLLQGKKMRFMDRHESPLSSSSRMIYICDGFPRFSLLPPSDFETFFFVNRKILSIRNITYKEIVFTWLFCEKKIHIYFQSQLLQFFVL